MSRQTVLGLKDALSEEQPTAKGHFSGPFKIFQNPYRPA